MQRRVGWPSLGSYFSSGIADYVVSIDVANLEDLYPQSYDRFNVRREKVTEKTLETYGTAQHLWFETDDMAILSFMLDCNIICWIDERNCWAWFNRLQFYTLDLYGYDDSKPTLFMRRVGVDHFIPVFDLRPLNYSVQREVKIHKRPQSVIHNLKTSDIPSNSLTKYGPADKYGCQAYVPEKTNEELLKAPHSIFPFNPPLKNYLMQICKRFRIAFTKTIFAKAIPVADVYFYDPDIVIKTQMDGHCGFHSVSNMITGDPNQHGALRIIIARHILANASRLEKLMLFENAKAVATADLGVNPDKPTEFWMRSLHIAAAADLFQLNILVKRRSRHQWTCYNSTTFNNGMDNTTYMPQLPSVLLNNESENHFEPVTNLKIIK